MKLVSSAYSFRLFPLTRLKKEDCLVLQELKSWEVEDLRRVLVASGGRLMEMRDLLRSAIGGSRVPSPCLTEDPVGIWKAWE